MPCNFIFDILRKSPKSPLPQTYYVFGMILVIIGVGSLIVSIDPRPLPSSFWAIFLVTGLLFIASGSLLLILTTKMRSYPVLSPTRIDVHDAVNSAADLLNDNLYDEIDGTSHAAYQNTVESFESVKAVSQCMMTRSENTPSPKRLFYKETIV